MGKIKYGHCPNEQFNYKIAVYRGDMFDVIKVSSRSDDQANSAKNLLSKMFNNIDFLIAQSLRKYKKEHPNYEENEELQNRIANVLFSRVAILEQNIELENSNERNFFLELDILDVLYSVKSTTLDFINSLSDPSLNGAISMIGLNKTLENKILSNNKK